MLGLGPGMAIRIGRRITIATEGTIATGANMARRRARTGPSTGSMEAASTKRSGTTGEAVTNTTMTIAREAATTMTSDGPGKTGKEIRRIMTSQISAPGKEAVALGDRHSKRRGSRADAAVVTEAKTRSSQTGKESQKALATTGQ